MSNPLRICHVVSGDLWGGAEAQMFQLVKHFVGMDNCKVAAITFNKGVLFDKLCSIPVDVVAIEESKKSSWKMISEMRSFFKKNKINLIHCHGFKENFFAGISARTLIKRVTIRTHHGRGVVNASLPKVIIEKINAYFLTSKMIAVSQELKIFLTGAGFPSRKINVIHNGIDCDRLFESKNGRLIREELLIPPGSFVIGTASRIEQEKGYEYLFLAFKELLDEGLPVILVIVGEGKLKQKYLKMSEEMNISKYVIFTGFQEDVCSYINIFDIFVMMSLNEGVPLALLEAMGMGKPVVCSAVGGIPEVIKSNFHGILVPAEDSRSCAAALKKILTCKDLQILFSKNALNRVKEKFSSIKTAEKTFNLYKKLLNK